MANNSSVKKTTTKTSTSKQSEKKTYPLLKVSGRAYWAKLMTPDNYGKYTIDVSLDDASIETFKKWELELKDTGDDRGVYASFQAYPKDKDGNDVVIPVFDAALKPFKGGLIGNGSLINLEFKPRDWEYMNRSGTQHLIKQVQVLKHIPYEQSSFKVEEEFLEFADETPAFTE